MSLYPWQQDSWRSLAGLGERWPHALLVHGQKGIGKTEFARHAAQAWLCESPGTPGASALGLYARPCGECIACKWFEQGNHPDFCAVFPENLATQVDSADAAEADSAQKNAAAKTKTPSKEIKVEQVRALIEFCGIGAHRAGRRVVLLYPAEALNAASANALLKTLEEPPEGVVFVLVSSQFERLLPTIVSRCRQWPMAVPAEAPAIDWLRAQGVAQAASALAQAGGAPLSALDDRADAASESAREFTLTQLAAGAGCDAFACAEALQKLAVPTVLGWIQRWMYDLLSVRLSGVARYYPQRLDALLACAERADVVVLAQLNQLLARERATEQHPLNVRLVFESLFLRYRAVFPA